MFKVKYIVARHDDKIYEKYLKPYMKGKRPILVDDAPELDSMTKKYNEGIKRLGKIKADDIVVFVHEDIMVLDKYLEGKLQMYFSGNPDIGVMGVYGSSSYVGGGWWSYERDQFACGKIAQGFKNGSIQVMSDNWNGNIRKDMVVVDGCFMAIRGDLLNELKFDEDIKGFHQYDNSYCLETLITTKYKVAVGGLELMHASEGEPNDDWKTQSIDLINRYRDMGLSLPLTSQKLKEVIDG